MCLRREFGWKGWMVKNEVDANGVISLWLLVASQGILRYEALCSEGIII